MSVPIRKTRNDQASFLANTLKVLDSITTLPTLPTIAFKAMQVIGDCESSAQDLADVLSMDQAATARLLRAANSVLYGSAYPISTTREAIVRLGFIGVQNMVVATALIDEFCQKARPFFDMEQFWQHSVACGIASRLLARQIGYHPEVAFTAGILHDIGRLFLEQFMLKDYLCVLKLIKEEGLASCEAEERVLGTNHAAVGGVLAAKWRLPLSLVDAIAQHEHPLAAEGVSQFAVIVYLADRFCIAQELHSGVAEPSGAISHEALHSVGLTEEALHGILSPFDRIEAFARDFISSTQGISVDSVATQIAS